MNEKSEMIIAIIDYGLGNLFSVRNACKHVGLNAEITNDKNVIEKADAAILPGVGAFNVAMKNLEKLDLIGPIKSFVDSGRPFMGICLGLQLLFTESEEFGVSRGLDLIGGCVVKFPAMNNDGKKVKVPQIGWNRIYKSNRTFSNKGNCLLKEIEDGEFMYFVHSFYVEPFAETNILTKTNYGGIEYCSSISFKNVFGVQFHPEKSGKKGIGIYSKWAESINNLERNEVEYE